MIENILFILFGIFVGFLLYGTYDILIEDRKLRKVQLYLADLLLASDCDSYKKKLNKKYKVFDHLIDIVHIETMQKDIEYYGFSLRKETEIKNLLNCIELQLKKVEDRDKEIKSLKNRFKKFVIELKPFKHQNISNPLVRKIP